MAHMWNRRPARIAVLVEMIVSILNALLLVMDAVLILFAVDILRALMKSSNASVNDEGRASSAYEVTTWVLIGATVVATGVDIWASAMFILATNHVTEDDVSKPLKMATIWRHVVIMMLIVGITTNVLTFSLISLGVTVVVRGVSLYLVLRFIRTLKHVPQSGTPPPPSSDVTSRCNDLKVDEYV